LYVVVVLAVDEVSTTYWIRSWVG